MNNGCKEAILHYVRSLGISQVGVAGDGATYSMVVCLFPYYVGVQSAANLSVYAYGRDYHVIVRGYLEKIAAYISILEPTAQTELFADTGGGNDKAAAYAAGLGIIGKNTLLINPIYGSYTFIGYVKTDLVMAADSPLEKNCGSCRACISACPGGALSADGVERARCASHISQKRGALSEEEVKILQKSGLVWGCDACQHACPYNKDVPKTPLMPFQMHLKPQLSAADVTAENFKNACGDRAFAWRGRAVLERNLIIFNQNP